MKSASFFPSRWWTLNRGWTPSTVSAMVNPSTTSHNLTAMFVGNFCLRMGMKDSIALLSSRFSVSASGNGGWWIPKVRKQYTCNGKWPTTNQACWTELCENSTSLVMNSTSASTNLSLEMSKAWSFVPSRSSFQIWSLLGIWEGSPSSIKMTVGLEGKGMAPLVQIESCNQKSHNYEHKNMGSIKFCPPRRMHQPSLKESLSTSPPRLVGPNLSLGTRQSQWTLFWMDSPQEEDVERRKETHRECQKGPVPRLDLKGQPWPKR